MLKMDCIVNTVHWPVSEKGMLKMDCILSLQCIVRMDILVKLWNITGCMLSQLCLRFCSHREGDERQLVD